MRHTWTLTLSRMRLAMRNRAFLFFSLIMPLAFLFLAMGIFARGLENATSYILGPVLALTVMGSFWGLSIQLVIFREQGILRRFRLAPIGAGSMLASSILSNYFLTLPTVIIEFVLARWIFHLQNWGNFWAVFALITLGTVTFAALGLTVASVTNTMQETQVINNLIWTVFLFLTGATVPLPKLPSWIQKLALFLPPTYLVEGLQRALTERNIKVWDLRAELLALAGGTIFSFWVSRQLFRWEPEQKVSGRAKAWAVSTIVPFLLLGAWEYSNGQLLRNSRLAYTTVRDAQTPSNRGR